MKKFFMLVIAVPLSGIMIARANIAESMDRISNGFVFLFGDSPRVVPPSVVRSAFDSRFPNAQVKNWTERKEAQKDSYIAYFRFNGKKLYAYYSPDGSWEGTGTPLKWSKELPAAVRQAWRHSDYAAWKIMDLKKIRTPDQTLYQLHLSNSPLLDADHDYAFQDECKLIYNARGELVRKETR